MPDHILVQIELLLGIVLCRGRKSRFYRREIQRKLRRHRTGFVSLADDLDGGVIGFHVIEITVASKRFKPQRVRKKLLRVLSV